MHCHPCYIIKCDYIFGYHALHERSITGTLDAVFVLLVLHMTATIGIAPVCSSSCRKVAPIFLLSPSSWSAVDIHKKQPVCHPSHMSPSYPSTHTCAPFLIITISWQSSSLHHHSPCQADHLSWHLLVFHHKVHNCAVHWTFYKCGLLLVVCITGRNMHDTLSFFCPC